MSNFCKQCSIEHFGKDYKDLANLSTKEDTLNELFPLIICEGCGNIQINHKGECVSKDCLCCGHK